MSRAAAALGLAGIAVATLVAARRPEPGALDHAAAGLAGRSLGTVGDHAAGALTDLGSVYGLAGLAGALTVGGRPRAALDVGAAGGLAWVAAQNAKTLAGRARPYETGRAQRLVSEPHGSSWPSGHTAVATAGAVALAPHLSPTGRRAAAVVAAGIGATRLYVGVHWLTDVVAGAAVGAASAVVSDRLLARLRG